MSGRHRQCAGGFDLCRGRRRTEQPPGIVINYIPSSTQIYVGSPGIAVLPNGHYLAKHDEFGPKSTENTVAITPVFRSVDRGQSWQRVATVAGMYWASIFVHQGNAYLIGTGKNHGFVVISRSTDEGVTWTVPKDRSSGLLLDDAKYHCAPVPVVVHEGRIWRAMEDVMGPGGWGSHFRAFVMSAPVGSDLLQAENWVSSNHLGRDPQWLGGAVSGLAGGKRGRDAPGTDRRYSRVDYRPAGEKAAIIEISADGKNATFDPGDRIHRLSRRGQEIHDPLRSGLEDVLDAVESRTAQAQGPGPRPRAERPGIDAVRRSAAVGDACIVLYHPDVNKHGFQYVDWLFEGEDIIAAARIAFGAGHPPLPASTMPTT